MEPEIDNNDAQEVSLEQQIIVRLDALGRQMDWLCENLASLFGFVQQMGQNGGGIRGMMKMLQQAPEMMGEPKQDA